MTNGQAVAELMTRSLGRPPTADEVEMVAVVLSAFVDGDIIRPGETLLLSTDEPIEIVMHAAAMRRRK